MTEGALKRVNIGCGRTPTPGWLNYDNSPSMRVARFPFLTLPLERLGLIGAESREFIAFLRANEILRADARRRIPLPGGSVEVLYTSHMLEHLDRRDAQSFLREVHRVLAPGGVVRIVVPDLGKLIERYVAEGDADVFVAKTLLAQERPRTFLQMLRYLVVGPRDHLWMYDGQSLCRLLAAAGFREAQVAEPGSTRIPDPGDLDLYERADQSVCVEAMK